MAKELEYFEETGLVLYAKPSPIVESPWGNDIVALTESGTVVGYYSANIGTPASNYTVFSRLGPVVATTDTPLGVINIPQTSSTGDGARTVTITVDDGSTNLENATVRLTEGSNSYVSETDVNGQIVFNVDDATYTVAITKSGYTFSGTTLVVDGDETIIYSMTVLTPSASPAEFSTGYAYVYLNGIGTSGIVIDYQIAKVPDGDGAVYDSVIREATSGVGGYIEFPNLPRLGEFRYKRGDGRWVVVDIPDSDSFQVTNNIGED